MEQKTINFFKHLAVKVWTIQPAVAYNFFS